VAARFEAALSAGDGVIAFGTGGYNGVAYIKVGDDEPRVIPDGQKFRASFVRVAGKKIILVDGYDVAVFDTVTESLKRLPDDEIHLALPIKGMQDANPLDVSGTLVATINDPDKVADHSLIKMIDVSGPDPVVFALGALDLEARETTAIAVDAVTGLVAISAQHRSAIYTVAAVAGAKPTRHDLSAQDGVESAPLIADHGLVGYRDDSGTARFRILDPASGEIQVLGTLGPSVCGYTMNAGRYAFATTDGHGSDFAFVTAMAPGAAETAPGTGDEMKTGNGKLGFGQTAAIAPDGTLFVAGAGQGGLGSGELLMVLSGGAWKELVGADGKTLPACDVTVGNGLLAFKTGARNDTTIGYATFGRTIKP
jgi:hypothetical protein